MDTEHTEQGLTRADLEDDEDLSLGYSVLHALAEVAEDMEQLAPGVWYATKRDDDRGTWI